MLRKAPAIEDEQSFVALGKRFPRSRSLRRVEEALAGSIRHVVEASNSSKELSNLSSLV